MNDYKARLEINNWLWVTFLGHPLGDLVGCNCHSAVRVSQYGFEYLMIWAGRGARQPQA